MALSYATDRRQAVQSARMPRPTEDFRLRALARLYERRSAVDQLILALERYQDGRCRPGAPAGHLSAAETLS